LFWHSFIIYPFTMSIPSSSKWFCEYYYPCPLWCTLYPLTCSFSLAFFFYGTKYFSYNLPFKCSESIHSFWVHCQASVPSIFFKAGLELQSLLGAEYVQIAAIILEWMNVHILITFSRTHPNYVNLSVSLNVK
jgi:hypothetical protein